MPSSSTKPSSFGNLICSSFRGASCCQRCCGVLNKSEGHIPLLARLLQPIWRRLPHHARGPFLISALMPVISAGGLVIRYSYEPMHGHVKPYADHAALHLADLLSVTWFHKRPACSACCQGYREAQPACHGCSVLGRVKTQTPAEPAGY